MPARDLLRVGRAMAAQHNQSADLDLQQQAQETGTDLSGTASRVDPGVLAYMIGPPALLLALVLEHFQLIASHSIWLWLAVFLATPLVNLLADVAYQRNPNEFRSNVQLAAQVVTITALIYLTGWGPVLIAAYSFGALVSISRNGSRKWRPALAWSLFGIVIGQILIALSWAPSFLSHGDALAVAIMSAFVLCFVIRMAAAIMARREMADASFRQSERRFRSLVQNSTDTTLVVAPDNSITYASPAAEVLLGYSALQLEGQNVMSLVHGEDADRASDKLTADLQTAQVSHPVQLKMVGRNGRVRDVEAVVTDLKGDPAIGGWVVNMRDITDRKAAEARLVYQAEHDALTRLPNRIVILDQADLMLSRCANDDKQLAVFFIDLDNFKDVNDSLGHEAGDEVLRVVADRLSAQLQAGEVIGRMGGDEFVVLAESSDAIDPTTTVAKHLRAMLAEPIRILGPDGPLIHVTASIGVARGVPDSANELLRNADIALYQAKLAGRDCWVSFVPEMRSAALRNLQLRSELTAAIEQQQFHLLYQPIIDLHNGKVTSVEALIRWEHPRQGVVSPDKFIPVLEQTGQIIDVGRWVLNEACRQGALWWSDHHQIGVNVNASARQLEDPRFVDDVMAALSTSGLSPHALVIEITESSLMCTSETANRSLALLKEHGVKVAIDDFGTGYSSLSYLLQFTVDALKVDGSFVSAMDTSQHAKAVVRAVFELGRSLDLEVIAEGIEDSEQLALLRAEGCRWGQGFLMSRPVAASVVTGMLCQPNLGPRKLAVSS
jgi:diguanylate cyclase (GGDEF)-like protein/PAS domain S-box-containing protein